MAPHGNMVKHNTSDDACRSMNGLANLHPFVKIIPDLDMLVCQPCQSSKEKKILGKISLLDINDFVNVPFLFSINIAITI